MARPAVGRGFERLPSLHAAQCRFHMAARHRAGRVGAGTFRSAVHGVAAGLDRASDRSPRASVRRQHLLARSADAGLLGRGPPAGGPRRPAGRARRQSQRHRQRADAARPHHVGVLRLPARGAAHRTPRRRHRRRPGVRVLVLSPRAPAAPGAAVGAVDAAGVLGLAPAARHRPDAGRAAVRRRGAAAAAVEPLLRGLPGHRPRRRRRRDADRAPRPAGRTGPRRAVRRRGHRRRRGGVVREAVRLRAGPGRRAIGRRRRRATAPHRPAS